MYKLLTVVLSLTLLAGCEDPQSAEHAKYRRDLSKVLHLSKEARQGFVSKTSKDQQAGQRQRLESFHRNRVDKVIDGLQPLSSRTAPSFQEQAAVKRLLADFDATSARHECRTATTRWSELANESNQLLLLMIRIDDTSSRADLSKTDDSDLIIHLNNRKSQMTNKHRDLKKVVDVQSVKIAELEQEIEQLEEQKSTAVFETSRLRERAFTATGELHHDLHRQGDDFERAAAAAESRIQRLTLQRDLHFSEREITSHHMSLAADVILRLDQQIGKATKRQTQTQESIDKAKTTQTHYSKQMYEQFQRVNDHYALDVEKALDAAATRATKAVDLCKTALRLDRLSRQTNQLNLMAAYLTHLHIVNRHISITGSYGRTLAVLASQADRLVQDRASSLHHTAEEKVAKQVELIEQAAKISRTVTELTKELSGSGDEEIAKKAQEYERAIEAYDKATAEAKLK